MASKGAQPKDFKKHKHVFVLAEGGMWLEGIVEHASKAQITVMIEGDEEAHPFPGHWLDCRHPTSEEIQVIKHRQAVIKKFKPGKAVMAKGPDGHWTACTVLAREEKYLLLQTEAFSFAPASFPGHWQDVREKNKEDLKKEKERLKRVQKATVGMRVKVLDEGMWFTGVVESNSGKQVFVKKDGDQEAFACPGDFQDIDFLSEEEMRAYEAKRAAELREKSRVAAASASAADAEQLYRDRLEFASKIGGPKDKKTFIAKWNLAAYLFENELTNDEAMALVEECRMAWAEDGVYPDPDKAKMAGRQLVAMWEAVGGEEMLARAADMRDRTGMKQVIVKTDKAPAAAKGDLMGGLAAALANRAKIQ